MVDLGAGYALALLEAERRRAEALLDLASARYPAFAVRLGDRFSRRWLEKHANPYLDEVHAVARSLGANLVAARIAEPAAPSLTLQTRGKLGANSGRKAEIGLAWGAQSCCRRRFTAGITKEKWTPIAGQFGGVR